MKRYLVFLTISIFFTPPAAAQGVPTYGNGRATGTITACEGSASTSPNIQQFTVYGNGLTSQMDITAPANFEVSLTPMGGYSGGITIFPVNGTIVTTTVYARSSTAAPPGIVTGTCLISTSNLRSMAPNLSATIYALPVLDVVQNQTLMSGKATLPINLTGPTSSTDTYPWIFPIVIPS